MSPLLDNSLRAASQIEDSHARLEDLRLLGIDDRVNSMSGRDLLKNSKEIILRTSSESLQLQVQSVLTTSIELGRLVKGALLGSSIINEEDVSHQGCLSDLQQQTLDKIIDILPLSEKERSELKQQLLSSDERERTAAFERLAEELDTVLSEPSNLDEIYAIALAIAEDPAVGEDLRETILETAKKLAQELTALRELLTDEILKEFLRSYTSSDSEDTTTTQHSATLRNQTGIIYERLKEWRKILFTPVERKPEEINLQELIANEREIGTIETHIKDSENLIDEICARLFLESNPSTREALMNEMGLLTETSDQLKKELVEIKRALSELR